MGRSYFAACLAPALAFALSVPPASARAETPAPLTAEQSASLSHALRLWTLGLVDDPSDFSATPADGGYALTIPLAGPLGGSGMTIKGDPVTTLASIGGDGRWHFDAITMPSPLTLTGLAGASGKPLRLTQTIGEQSGSAIVDPTLAGPSSGETTRRASRLLMDLDGHKVAVNTASSATHIEWAPASPGRADMASVTRIEDMRVRPEPAQGTSDQPPQDGPADDRALGVSIHAATVTVQTGDADPDRMSDLMRPAFAFGATLGDGVHDGLTPQQRSALHAMLALLPDLARSTKQSVAVDGLVANTTAGRVGLDHLSLSQTMAAPDGTLDAHMRLEVAGVNTSILPPGALRDLLPHRLVFAPYVTGTSSAELYAMAEAAIDDKPDPRAMADDAKSRLTKMPVTAGIEELSFDLGPASVTAKGRIVADGPDALDGTATISASGLAALIKKAGTDPLLKQGVPVLLFLKGLGQESGDTVTWEIVYKDDKMTVNGADMSALLPHQ